MILSTARIVQLALLATMGMLLQLAYWVFWPVNVIHLNKPLHVANRTVLPGDWIVVEMDYCKPAQYTDTEADVYISYVNHLAYLVPGATMERLPTGCRVNSQLLEVPELPPGEYRLSMTRVYAVNPLRRSTVYAESEPFVVVGERGK